MTIRPHAPPPKWRPSRSTAGLDPRVLLAAIGVVALTIGVITSVVPLSVAALVSLLASIFVGFGFISRRRRFRAFEKDFARAIQHSADSAADVYSKAWAVRLFSPRGVLLPKVGLVELERGHARRAETFFEQAWLLTERDHKSRLIGPLVRAKAQLGRWSDVLVLSKDWANSSMTPANARVYLAAAILETGDNAKNAVERARAEIKDTDGGLSPDAHALLERVRERIGRAEPQ